MRKCCTSLFLLCASLCTFAQSYTLVGSTKASGRNEFQLTDKKNGPGAVWYSNKIDLSSDFVISTQIFLGDNNAGADGIAFVLQPLSNDTIGIGGYGLGYGGITPSLIVEFDTYRNKETNDPGENVLVPTKDHLAFLKNGNQNHKSGDSLVKSREIDNIEDTQWHDAVFTWTAATHTLAVTADFLQTPYVYDGDIIQDIFGGSPYVYWGFTGAIGALSNNQFVTIIRTSFVDCPNIAVPVTSSRSTSICGGESVTLTAPAGHAHRWIKNDGAESGVQQSIVIAESGQYKVEVTFAENCKATSSENIVTVSPLPTGSITPSSSTICPGNSVQLTATGGTVLEWLRTEDNTIVAKTPTYHAERSGTYKALISNGNCSNWTSSAVVNVNPAITSSHSATLDKCNRSNGSITISNVSGGSSNTYLYSIDNGASFSSQHQFFNLQADDYKVVVKNNNTTAACLSTSKSVTVGQASSDINVTSIDVEPVTCTSVNGLVTIKATGGTHSYWYSLDNSSFQPFVGPDSTFQLAPGAHTVTIKDSDSCGSTTTFTIEKKDALPIFEVQDPSPSCQGAAVDLTHGSLKNSTDAALTFSYWADAAATQPLVDSQAVRAAATYYIKAVNPFGCATIKPINVRFIGKPHADFTTSTPICTGTATMFISTTRTTDDVMSLTYTWKVNDSVAGSGLSLSTTFNRAGTYTVTLIAMPSACSALADDTTRSITITAVEAGRKDTIVVESGVPNQLSARLDDGLQYLWRPADSLDNANSRTPMIKTSVDKTYTVSITKASGCRIDDVLVVHVTKLPPDSATEVFVPTAFTPNKNGENDRLRPRFINVSELLYFKVYNRWGQLVFETNIRGKGWDGNLKGQPQPTETYSWILACKDATGHIIKKGGHSVLIR